MARAGGALDPAELLPFMESLDCRGRLLVAFSGGVDSTALLIALGALRADLGAPVEAVHVNHGTHPEAARWTRHCQLVCEALQISLTVTDPPAEPLGADNPEARMREWRLGRFEALLGKDDIICTAHHEQDQAETLLLALLRGSGPEGLSAMPAVRPLGRGRLARPLLNIPRLALEALVARRGITSLDDPSNRDTRMDRNYLRYRVMPVLRERWPAAESSLARSAALLGEARAQLESEGTLALAGREVFPGVLRIDGLRSRGAQLRRLLRLWLLHQGAAPLPGKRLQELAGQLHDAGADSAVQINWADHSLDYYRDRLWLDKRPALPCTNLPQWNSSEAAALGPASGQLSLEGPGDPLTLCIAARRGGERYRTAPDRPSRALKQWFTQCGLPPWYRESIPLLFEQERLLAAGDRVFDEAFDRHLAERGARLRWSPADPTLEWLWKECRRGRLQVK